MIAQSLSQSITLEEFWDTYPDGYACYELHDGVIKPMQPTGTQEQVGGFITVKLAVQIESLQLPYLIPRQAMVKPVDENKTLYIPDVIVLDQNTLQNESLWQKRSTITQGSTIKLVVEVVSTNWRDDYGRKLMDYEALGIGEYWIVDYLGLGGKRYIGNPKRPTLSIHTLVEDEYQINQFRAEQIIISPTLPNLKLTANQVFGVTN